MNFDARRQELREALLLPFAGERREETSHILEESLASASTPEPAPEGSSPAVPRLISTAASFRLRLLLKKVVLVLCVLAVIWQAILNYGAIEEMRRLWRAGELLWLAAPMDQFEPGPPGLWGAEKRQWAANSREAMDVMRGRLASSEVERFRNGGAFALPEGDPKETAAYWESRLAQAPEDPALLALLALAKFRTGQDAASEVDRFEKLEPGNGWLRVCRAAWLAQSLGGGDQSNLAYKPAREELDRASSMPVWDDKLSGIARYRMLGLPKDADYPDQVFRFVSFDEWSATLSVYKINALQAAFCSPDASEAQQELERLGRRWAETACTPFARQLQRSLLVRTAFSTARQQDYAAHADLADRDDKIAKALSEPASQGGDPFAGLAEQGVLERGADEGELPLGLASGDSAPGRLAECAAWEGFAMRWVSVALAIGASLCAWLWRRPAVRLGDALSCSDRLRIGLEAAVLPALVYVLSTRLIPAGQGTYMGLRHFIQMGCQQIAALLAMLFLGLAAAKCRLAGRLPEFGFHPRRVNADRIAGALLLVAIPILIASRKWLESGATGSSEGLTIAHLALVALGGLWLAFRVFRLAISPRVLRLQTSAASLAFAPWLAFASLCALAAVFGLKAEERRFVREMRTPLVEAAALDPDGKEAAKAAAIRKTMLDTFKD